MSQHRYFKGPELDALLEEVRRELGAEAMIVEANKVRSGGVAGFFATENFEVVATDPESTDELGVDDDPFEVQAFDRDPVDRGIFPAARADEVVDISASNGSNGSKPNITRPAPAATALLERADAVSVLERVDISVADNEGDAVPKFDEVLAAELATMAAEHEVERPSLQTSADPTEAAAPAIAPGVPLDPEVATREPAIAAVVTAEPASLWPADAAPPAIDTTEDKVANHAQIIPTEPASSPGPITKAQAQPTAAASFWDRYDALQAAPRSDTDRSSIVTVIGQLANAADVAEVLARDWDMPVEPVVVTTSQAVATPDWNIERSLRGLEARVQYWKQTGRHGIVTVDAGLQNDARAYIDAARDAGSEALHLAVKSHLSHDDLLGFVEAQTGDVVVHFADRPTPDYLMGLAERGVVVGSVDGLTIDPSMMLALTMAAGRG